MPDLYLMKRTDMNQGFPERSPSGIEPYLETTLVIINENGDVVPLESRGFGDIPTLSTQVVERLKSLQSRGFRIKGDVHPFYEERPVIRIGEDLEIYEGLSPDSAENKFLACQGINIEYKIAA